MNTVVEMRCPLDYQRMFGKIVVESKITSDNLMEFACDKCRRRTGLRTFHYFNILGEHVKTRSESVP